MDLKILFNCCLIEINKINKSRHPKYNKLNTVMNII